MTFEWPVALVGLVAVPVLVALYFLRERRRTEFAARFTTPALLPNLVDSAPSWRRHLPLAVLLVALAAMVVGVARPHAIVSVPREEATVILALDTSLSMRAKDVRPTRLAAARGAARAFQGTALGDAVSLGVQLGRRQRAKDGTVPPTAILVISDGANMSGRTTPDAAAQQARSFHIPVSAIVVGTDNGVVTVSLTGGYRAQIRVPPSPETLRRLTRATGGQFFTASNDAGLRQVYGKLGSRLGHRRQSREITDFFAGGSAALLLVGGAMSALWFRRVP